MSSIRRVTGSVWRGVVAVGAGLLAGFSFEPIAAGWLAPVAMALLWVIVHEATLVQAARRGVAFGLAFMLTLLLWLNDSIGTFAWLGLSGALACAVGAAAVGIRAVAALPAAPVWGAAVWATVEVVRSNWPLGGMPWGRLGFAAIDTPWSDLLPYVGVTGTGFGLSALGFVVGQAMIRRDGVHAMAALVLLGVTVLPLAVPFTIDRSGSMTVAAVQGGVPGRGNDLVAHHREVTRNHVEATVALGEAVRGGKQPGLDLVVWPENSTAVDPVKDAQARAGINQAAAAVGVPVLVGGIVDGPTDEEALNQGLVWLPGGEAASRYTKHHPVPFGEYIPFRSLIEDWVSRFDGIPRDMTAGSGDEPLSISGTQVADAICFDIAYDDVIGPQVRQGAQLAVVQTSNATFFGTTQLEQQFAITRVRALEVGRSVVVASTNGVTGFIAPDGSIVGRADVGDTETLVREATLSSTLTPAVRLQGLWTIAVLSLAFVGLGVRVVQVRRRAARPRGGGKASQVGVVVGE